MKRVLIALIRFYQKHISPHTARRCRYLPTCSEYAIQSLERFGFFKGTYLAFRRVLRCNPFGGYGFDPVPERKLSSGAPRGKD